MTSLLSIGSSSEEFFVWLSSKYPEIAGKFAHLSARDISNLSEDELILISENREAAQGLLVELMGMKMNGIVLPSDTGSCSPAHSSSLHVSTTSSELLSSEADIDAAIMSVLNSEFDDSAAATLKANFTKHNQGVSTPDESDEDDADKLLTANNSAVAQKTQYYSQRFGVDGPNSSDDEEGGVNRNSSDDEGNGNRNHRVDAGNTWEGEKEDCSSRSSSSSPKVENEYILMSDEYGEFTGFEDHTTVAPAATIMAAKARATVSAPSSSSSSFQFSQNSVFTEEDGVDTHIANSTSSLLAPPRVNSIPPLTKGRACIRPIIALHSLSSSSSKNQSELCTCSTCI